MKKITVLVAMLTISASLPSHANAVPVSITARACDNTQTIFLSDLEFSTRHIGPSMLSGKLENKSSCDYPILILEIAVKTKDGRRLTDIITVKRIGPKESAEISGLFFDAGPEEIDDITASILPPEGVDRLVVEEQKKIKENVRSVLSKKHGSGFNGIFLGMHKNDLKLLAIESEIPWSLDYDSDSGSIFHPIDNKELQIGCEGNGSNRVCHEVKSAHVEYFNDKVVRVVIQSDKYDANNIDSILRNWSDFAIESLIKKYGKPLMSPKKINIFSFKQGFYVPVASWRPSRSGEEISVSTDSSEFEFGICILYEDIAGMKAMAADKKKNRKSNL
jgi:hypothetical protein